MQNTWQAPKLLAYVTPLDVWCIYLRHQWVILKLTFPSFLLSSFASQFLFFFLRRPVTPFAAKPFLQSLSDSTSHRHESWIVSLNSIFCFLFCLTLLQISRHKLFLSCLIFNFNYSYSTLFRSAYSFCDGEF